MSKGFVVFAQNTDKVDYVKQAYALALSIKATQSTVTNISIITNDSVPDEYRALFDNIIEIPWGDLAKNPLWKVENRWKVYHASPYEETIVLDTDMLFLEDISFWWEYCSTSDLKFCCNVKNYKDETIKVDLAHRKAFVYNDLPNPYVALHYFKKSQLAHDFYKVLEFVVKNWDECYNKYAPKNMQKWVSIDLSAAIAIHLMGIEETLDKKSPLEFVHMKPGIQGWSPVPATWQDIVPHSFNKRGELFIGNYKQRNLLHYVEKSFLTDSLIEKLKLRVYHG